MDLVFISYARSERQWAERLDIELSALGHACWRDRRDLRDGEDFTGEIELAIRRSSHVVPCLTPEVASRSDSFVRREIQYAINRCMRNRRETGKSLPVVLPVVMPGGELPVNIATYGAVFINGDTDFSEGVRELSQRIKAPVVDTVPRPPTELRVTLYLRMLHDALSDALEKTVHTLLTLSAADTPGATSGSILAPVLQHFTIPQILEPPVAVSGTPAPPMTLGEAFGRSGGRLLVLGAPGAGKTTALLAFARDAAVAALDDPSLPVPVLVNIKTWDGTTPLRTWAAAPHEEAASEGRRLLYLLDGLDELVLESTSEGDDEKVPPRGEFLDRIAGELAREQVVITSRVEEYRRLGRSAALGGAVTIQPLTTEQIRNYLHVAGRPWLWRAVAADAQLLDVARTPLLLALFSVSFTDPQEIPSGGLTGLTESGVFDRYVSKRFSHERTRGAALPFSEPETRRLLAELATDEVWEFDERQSLPHQRPDFLEFAERMHFLRRTNERDYQFIHLRMRDFFALPRLNELLDTLDPSDAVSFFLLAEQIGTPALPLFARALDHPDKEIRRDAVIALQRLGGVAVVPLLLKAKSDSEKDVRWDIDYFLDRLGESVAPALIAGLTGPDDRVRRFAAEHLAKWPAAAVPAFAAALADRRPHVRVTAATALGQIGRAAKGASSVSPISSLLVPLLADEEADVRATAAAALGRFADAETAATLMDHVRDENPQVRGSVAAALAAAGCEAATPDLVGLLQDNDNEVRISAAKALAGMPGAKALAAAVAYVQAPETSQGQESRYPVLEALWKRSDANPDVLGPLFVEVMQRDGDDLMREYAGYGLKALAGPPSLVPALERIVRTDKANYVRQAAFDAIVAIQGKEADAFARGVLEGADLELAALAARFLLEQFRDQAAPLIDRQVCEGRTHVTGKTGAVRTRSLGRAIEDTLSEYDEAWAIELLRKLPWRGADRSR